MRIACNFLKMQLQVIERFKTGDMLCSDPQPFWHQGLVSWKTIFPQTGQGGWFRDDSNTLHLQNTLFLLLLYQLQLRSLGIRSQGLRIPAV